ncbi:MAG: hypothetical protein KGQ93_07560 [Cyanobacteria bacterium REEB459]|nr:hypothetical protein [Cyanobacteria bacterium REEB459]
MVALQRETISRQTLGASGSGDYPTSHESADPVFRVLATIVSEKFLETKPWRRRVIALAIEGRWLV